MLCSTGLCEFRDEKLDEHKGRTPESCSFGFCPNGGGGGMALPKLFVHFGTFALKKSGTTCPNWGEGGGVKVIWTKSKRTANFFRETVPNSQQRRETHLCPMPEIISSSWIFEKKTSVRHIGFKTHICYERPVKQKIQKIIFLDTL